MAKRINTVRPDGYVSIMGQHSGIEPIYQFEYKRMVDALKDNAHEFALPKDYAEHLMDAWDAAMDQCRGGSQKPVTGLFDGKPRGTAVVDCDVCQASFRVIYKNHDDYVVPEHRKANCKCAECGKRTSDDYLCGYCRGG